MNNQPPKCALRFFRWFCHPEFVEDIEGDLLERFEKRIDEKKAARWLFILEVVKLFRPGLIKNFEGTQQLNNYGMIKTMFTIAWRNALRQKQFTILNLLGLTIGIATSMAIGLYIYDELSYDTFHEYGDRIYRINQSNIWGDWDELSSNTGPNVAVALREDAPEFEQVTRLLSQGAQVIRPAIENDNKPIFKENAFFAAEENYLDVFTFDFLAGDPSTALHSPNHMLLTLETAQKYFGEDHSPDQLINKEVEVKAWDGSWQTFTVKGVLENIPSKSHIQFDVLVSLKSYQELMDIHGWKWIWTAFSTYGLIYEHVDVADLEEKIQSLPPKWASPTTERIFNQTFDQFTDGHPWKLDLQPMREIYISNSPNSQVFGPSGNPLFVKVFFAIGLLVLILSAINFMNLSTARSSSRSKEVGIRKVLGSTKRKLVNQFILESTLFVIVSTILGLAIVQLSLGWFNNITDKQMSFTGLIDNPLVILILLGFILMVGVLSGSYPAFYLSSFSPIKALKEKASGGYTGKRLRNTLVVFQFSISIALIICSAFVQKQLSYTSSIDLGIRKDNILQIHNIEQFGFKTETIKQRIQTFPAFEKVGKSFGVPPNIWSGDRYSSADDKNTVLQLSNLRTEADYLEVLDVKFLAGRNFDSSRPTDKYKVILNESATTLLGWYNSDDAIGKKLAVASGNEDEFEIIGVIHDFNTNGLKSEIPPLVIIHQDNDKVWDYGAGLSFYSMRVNPELIQSREALTEQLLNLEKELADIDPTVPFEFSFMDQEFEQTFRFEQKMSKVLNLFTFMALLIGCLGLFGLAAFSAEQRIKELSIRKVLGASMTELVMNFSSEFTRLISVAVLVACPLAWLVMDSWLTHFAYRTSLDIWVFAVAVIGTFIIALGTISYQSVWVALKNPAETLKDE
jgi:putative ABC transport system permease protein